MMGSHSQCLDKALQELKEIRAQCIEVQKCVLESNNIYKVDLLVMAVINRSMSNIDGFCVMLNQGNFMVAVSIIRLQLDTLLRFFSFHLLQDPEGLAQKAINGKRLDQIIDSSQKTMSDNYLINMFIEKNPEATWVKSVYKETCGFIHLSSKHIDVTMRIDEDKMTGYIDGKGRPVPIDFKLEAIEGMCAISNFILHYVQGWGETKTLKKENNRGGAKEAIPQC